MGALQIVESAMNLEEDSVLNAVEITISEVRESSGVIIDYSLESNIADLMSLAISNIDDMVGETISFGDGFELDLDTNTIETGELWEKGVDDPSLNSQGIETGTNGYASIAEPRSFDDYIPMVAGAAFGAVLVVVIVASVVLMRRRRTQSEQTVQNTHGAVASASMGSDNVETAGAVIEMR